MCGIAGFVNAPIPDARRHTSIDDLARMCDDMAHRGPDARGLVSWNSSGVEMTMRPSAGAPAFGLAHARLAVIDLTAAANQPMHGANKRWWLVFNGEIYNYLELRRELEALGRRFLTDGDSEVLLASFEEWGAECLGRLVGMFSFAVIDLVNRTLFAARDPFGIKPFYYAQAGHSFAFASEIAPLLRLAWVSRRADASALQRYVRFGSTDGGDRTMFQEVKQLPGGNWLALRLDAPAHVTVRQYWGGIQPSLTANDITFTEAARTVRSLFVDSVTLHMRSDVSIGSALSGGIDSSSIVTAMRRIGGPTLDLHTFSYIATDPRLSEERWIDSVVTLTNAVDHKVEIRGEELPSLLETAIAAHDEPLGGTSLLAQYCVFRAAAQSGIKVMLDGQGADELLGGYHPYLGARLASIVRQRRYLKAVRFARCANSAAGMSSATLFQHYADTVLPPSLQTPIRGVLGRELVPSWVHGAWFRDRSSPLRPPHYTNDRDALRRRLLSDMTGPSLSSLLRYEDRNSMACSVESRVPFLTTPLVEFVLRLPEEYLVSDSAVTKAVFREAMKDFLPPEIFARKDKIGFATPSASWLAFERRTLTEALLGDAATRLPFLDVATLKQALLSTSGPIRSGTSEALWRLYFLMRWTQQRGVEYA